MLMIVTFATLAVFIMGSAECSYIIDPNDGKIVFIHGEIGGTQIVLRHTKLGYLTTSFFFEQTPDGVWLDAPLAKWRASKVADYIATFGAPTYIGAGGFRGDIDHFIDMAWNDYHDALRPTLSAKPEVKAAAKKDSEKKANR